MVFIRRPDLGNNTSDKRATVRRPKLNSQRSVCLSVKKKRNQDDKIHQVFRALAAMVYLSQASL